MAYTIIETCGICGAPHECVAIGQEDLDQGIKGSCTGLICDNGPNKSCYRHFCKECLPKHDCSKLGEEK